MAMASHASIMRSSPALFHGQPSLFGGLIWWIICYPLAIVLSIIGAMLADILEPAYIVGPSHRGFFHSSHGFLAFLMSRREPGHFGPRIIWPGREPEAGRESA